MCLLIFSIVINEVMSNPMGKTGTNFPEDRNEFIELYNETDKPINLNGWIISDMDTEDEICAWDNTDILKYYPDVIINTLTIPAHGYALILDREYLKPDPEGKYEMPYSIPESTVILTTDDTSLGDGLTSSDPVIIVSPENDTSSFGTPFLDDGFPSRTPDGFSWERGRFDLKDEPYNWAVCMDSLGSTPGAKNSTLTHRDISINYLSFNPYFTKQARDVELSFFIINTSFVPFENINYRIVADTTIEKSLSLLNAMDSVKAYDTLFLKKGAHRICVCLNTKNSSYLNDTIKTVYTVGKKGYMVLSSPVYYPLNPVKLFYTLPDAHGYLKISLLDERGKFMNYILKKRIEEKNGFYIIDKDIKAGIYFLKLEYKQNNKTIRDLTPFIVR